MFLLSGKRLKVARTVVHFFMFTILGMMTSIPGPTLMDLVSSSQTDSRMISFIFTARSVGFLIGSLSGGLILDKMKKKEWAFVASSFVVSLGAWLVPWCCNLPTLLTTFGVAGFAMGFCNTGSNGCCLRTWGRKGAPVLQGLHFCYGLGGLLAPLMAAPLLSNAPSPVLVIYSSIGGVAALGCLGFVGLALASSSEASVGAEVPPAAIRDPGRPFTALVVLLACLQTGLTSGVEVSFTQLFASYAVQSGGGALTKSDASFLTSAYWIAFAVARALSAFVTMALPVHYLLGANHALSVAAAVLLLALPTTSKSALAGEAALLGAGVAAVFPGTLSWVEKYVEIGHRGASAFTALSSVLEMTVPLALSWHLDARPNVLFEFLTAATCSSFALFAVLSVVLARKGEKYVRRETLPPDAQKTSV